ncbi:TIGR02217 family protein [Falsigemmobacter intermedius]|uniref:TIGR02217 family protein n=1 Tax=Falsigemmobacter intermedius TaxID=1553448 RepID=A0A3S3YRJ6_9RHOB|nr:DUF2460 domain-containing protein [Falsigemmobacter intermedius]RWY44691.1 TIGR02217 family protein [Falsigemmobacter intermedius]
MSEQRNFHEVRFPADLSFGSVGGPERRAEIVTLANGYEERNSPWAQSRRRYDAGLGLRSLDDVAELVAFFEARAGQLYGFRWKDWADFKSCAPSASVTPLDQLLGQGDGAARDFALRKVYASGGQAHWRAIAKPVRGSLQVALAAKPLREGIDWEADYERGVLTFADPVPEGAEVRAGFEFDVPVRFDTDVIQVSVASFQAGDLPMVPVVEIRL